MCEHMYCNRFACMSMIMIVISIAKHKELYNNCHESKATLIYVLCSCTCSCGSLRMGCVGYMLYM